MSSNRTIWPWYAGAGALVALDQWTKILVRQRFDIHESVSVIGGDLVRLTYVLNPGIAFGLQLPNLTLLMIFGWVAAILLAVYLSMLIRRNDPLRWPVMLFLAGAIGNSIDRVLFGQVTDFVDVDFPDFIMERWPVFNVADSCVSIGIVLMVALLLFHRRHVAEPSYSHSIAGTQSGTNAVPDNDRSGPAASAH